MGLGHFWGARERLGSGLDAGRVRAHRTAGQEPARGARAEAQHETEVYVRGMKQMSQFLIPHMERAITLPAGARRLLDLGGSHGDYARALVRRYLACRRRS